MPRSPWTNAPVDTAPKFLRSQDNELKHSNTCSSKSSDSFYRDPTSESYLEWTVLFHDCSM